MDYVRSIPAGFSRDFTASRTKMLFFGTAQEWTTLVWTSFLHHIFFFSLVICFIHKSTVDYPVSATSCKCNLLFRLVTANCNLFWPTIEKQKKNGYPLTATTKFGNKIPFNNLKTCFVSFVWLSFIGLGVELHK